MGIAPSVGLTEYGVVTKTTLDSVEHQISSYNQLFFELLRRFRRNDHYHDATDAPKLNISLNVSEWSSMTNLNAGDVERAL